MFVFRIAIVILSFLPLLELVESFRMPPSSTGVRYRPSQQCAVGASSASDRDDVIPDDRLMHSTYDELATRLIRRYQSDASSNKLKNNQLFVCIAGGPGSGKSTLSMAVAQQINEQMLTAPNDNDTGVVIETAPASIVRGSLRSRTSETRRCRWASGAWALGGFSAARSSAPGIKQRVASRARRCTSEAEIFLGVFMMFSIQVK